MKNKRIALFGGTFDPIHIGHTTVAAAAAAHLGVERLTFIPARQSPLKSKTPYVDDAMRVRLIELAIAENPLFDLSTCELERPVPSYTLNTIQWFRRQLNRDTELFWLIGADAIAALGHWYRVQELVEQCTVATMLRAGCAKPDFTSLVPVVGAAKVNELQRHILPTPAVACSSSDIRERIRLGKDVKDMLHPAVHACIAANGLYAGR